MPTRGECNLLVPNPKGVGLDCTPMVRQIGLGEFGWVSFYFAE